MCKLADSKAKMLHGVKHGEEKNVVLAINQKQHIKTMFLICTEAPKYRIY